MLLIADSFDHGLQRIPISFQEIRPAPKVDIAGGQKGRAQSALHVFIDLASGSRRDFLLYQNRMARIHRMSSWPRTLSLWASRVFKRLQQRSADQQQRRI